MDGYYIGSDIIMDEILYYKLYVFEILWYYIYKIEILEVILYWMWYNIYRVFIIYEIYKSVDFYESYFFLMNG